jgi:16S rRNA (guanine527-N7)-methyltransferase
MAALSPAVALQGVVDPSLARRVAHIAQAVGVALDERQRSQLTLYLQLLHKWNRVYNLTSIRDMDEALTVHLADCLAALPVIAKHVAEISKHQKLGDVSGNVWLLDVGSGGGLPGVIIAICYPQWHVTACDAVQKKCAFLLQVKAELQLANLHVQHARVETLPEHGRYALIVCRAFSDLALFVQLTLPLLAPQGAWLAMKGQPPQEEIAALPAHITARIEPLTVPGLDAQRCLVQMQPKQVHTQASETAPAV